MTSSEDIDTVLLPEPFFFSCGRVVVISVEFISMPKNLSENLNSEEGKWDCPLSRANINASTEEASKNSQMPPETHKYLGFRI